MKIGDRIKKKRLENKLSQTELAQKIGVSKQTLYKYENSIITNIPSDKVGLLSISLDTSPSYLMGWEETKSKTEATENQLPIMKYYASLNDFGKREATKRVQELTYLPKYATTDVLNAAHETPGATEEEKKHDDDIMDDENF